MSGGAFTKIGRLMVPNGKFKDQSGAEKTRWHEIGIVLATPHHSKITVKLHANGFGEGQFATVFYDDDKKPHFVDRGTMTAEPVQPVQNQNAPAPEPAPADDEINFEDIPF